ncbi:MAG: VanW family protein [Patescibacteria group bacterium]
MNFFSIFKKNDNRTGSSGIYHCWRRIIFIAIFLLILVFFSLIVTGFWYEQTNTNKIYPGIKIGKIDLGGLTNEEAVDLLKPLMGGFEKKGMPFYTLKGEERKDFYVRSVFIAVSDPDLSRRILILDLEETVEQAMSVGREGNFLKRFYEINMAALRHKKLKPSYYLSKEDLKNILIESTEGLEQKPQNASFRLLKNGQIELVAEKGGIVFDCDRAVNDEIISLENLDHQPVYIPSIEQQPTVTIEDVRGLLPKIQDLLDQAPIVLTYQSKEWPVSQKELAFWLEIEKNKFSGDRIILNKDVVDNYLNILAKQIDVRAQNGKLKIEENKVTEFQINQPGFKLDIDASQEKIINNLQNKESRVELVVNKIEPEILTEDINDLSIKELVGQGVSNFAGSPKNRRHNIGVGVKKLNGILIKPGEEFSLVKALGKVDEVAGFLPELVIKGNRTIPELGGGLCQIGTTMFRVALNGGFPITARTPHSYRVVYYEPAGMDATIYNPQPDLRFINDTGYYLLLQTRVSGDNVIFDLYGTSDGRKVELSKPILSNIVKPGPPLYIESEDLKPGQKKKLESAHAGASAEFTRTITHADGAIKNEKWKSYYKPWQEVWLVGKETVVPLSDDVVGSTGEIKN